MAIPLKTLQKRKSRFTPSARETRKFSPEVVGTSDWIMREIRKSFPKTRCKAAGECENYADPNPAPLRDSAQMARCYTTIPSRRANSCKNEEQSSPLKQVTLFSTRKFCKLLQCPACVPLQALQARLLANSCDPVGPENRQPNAQNERVRFASFARENGSCMHERMGLLFARCTREWVLLQPASILY